jgi:LppP/LprE lipoprotein
LGSGGEGREVPLLRRLRLLAAFMALPVLAGCGGGSHTTAAVTTPRTVTRTVTVPASPPTSAGTTTGSATTAAPPPDPNAPLTLRAAEQTLAARGFAALTERDFRPDQPLKVLVGVRRGSADARTQQAFFFVGDRFIGTDTADPSAGISVAGQSGDEVTLAYELYKPSDALCCPSGGMAQVAYRWTGTRLQPQGAIPPSASGAAASRR